jgi:alpha-tubulin suppressor-like RCC1 family protein
VVMNVQRIRERSQPRTTLSARASVAASHEQNENSMRIRRLITWSGRGLFVLALASCAEQTGPVQPEQPAEPPMGKGSSLPRVSAGANHSCAVREDATLVCWGDNTYGQSSAPTGTFSQVSAAQLHTGAINASGAIVCWGEGSNSWLSAPSGSFSDIAAGINHTCALDMQGHIACWGSNAFGQTNTATANISTYA